MGRPRSGKLRSVSGWIGQLSRKLRQVAREGALDGLAQSRPGKRGKQRDHELEDARAEAERLRTALAEMAVRLTLAEGKDSWG